MFAGLAPAAHALGADLITPLKGGSSPRGRSAPRRLRSLLVAAQAAVSVLLIVVATLFVRATFRAATIDAGFDADGLYAISLGPGDHAWMRAVSELQAVPGVRSASLVELTPFGGGTRISIAGEGPGQVVTYFNRAGAEYFDTMGLRILAGRTFTRDEIATRAPVAVISRSLAKTYWRDQSPLGQMLKDAIKIPEIPASPRPMIIGVVGDSVTAHLHERNGLAVYQPFNPGVDDSAEIMMRIAPGTSRAVQQVSRRLRESDLRADVRIASIAARVDQEARRPRMLATLTGVVGAIAIVLCVIGLYGLTASVVGQRVREMSLRAALGAAPLDLLRLLMWESLRPVVVGMALGAGAALLASRVVVSAMFFGVSPRDPMALAGSAVILLAAASLAVLVPTRRAAAVDATAVLRAM